MKQNRVKQAKLVPISCGTGPTLAPVKVFLTLQFGFSHISFIQIYNRLAIPPPPLYWGRCHPVNYELAQSRQTTGPTLRFLYSFYKLDIMHTYIYFITICLPNPSCEIWSRIDVKHSLDLLQGHFQSSHSDLSKKNKIKTGFYPKKLTFFAKKTHNFIIK